MEQPTHHYDPTQERVIDFSHGSALVLAAPGCGKTHILTRRIVKAHQSSVPYEQMLCLTFTNRAARSMHARIEEELGRMPTGLFVGNLHRFCIRFLFENSLLPLDTTIIDEMDQDEILTALVYPEEADNPQGKHFSPNEIKKVTDAAAYLYEKEAKFPADLHLHKHFEPAYQPLAQQYRQYKQENGMVDFDDLLLLTYHHLSSNAQGTFALDHFPWIQVDEVQDLNPLQLAIIDQLITPDGTLLYLGDERQAIYSFLGTNDKSVLQLGSACDNHVFHLSNNYRSPKYLLDMLNDYAQHVLHVPAEQLPVAFNSQHIDDGLTLVRCDRTGERTDNQPQVLAMIARQLYQQTQDESIGILVRTNQQADDISTILAAHGLPHISITRKDVFKSIDFKTLLAHFSVVVNDTRMADWLTLFTQTKVVEKKSHTRRCIQRMRQIGLLPTDLIRYPNSSYCLELAKSYAEREIVVFDTETTGLDFFTNDIIQIAAVKLRGGQKVEGSELDIIIRTDQEIPAQLGELPNPMVEEYRRREKLSPEEGFRCFLDYVGDAELVGHNVNYDVQILRNNLQRRTPQLALSDRPVWDTLKLARLLDPHLRHYRLESLLEVYGLEGENSHNALDDIYATVSLLRHCYARILEKAPAQRAFLDHSYTQGLRQRLLDRYAPLYAQTADKLYAAASDEMHTLDYEIASIYEQMVDHRIIVPIALIDYVRQLFRETVVQHEREPYFYQQLTAHLHDIRSFNEADLFDNNIIRERICIMTMHKAKGLEFDHVLIHNASKGSLPFWKSTPADTAELARLLYVALSRARKTLGLTYVGELSPFLSTHAEVADHFSEMPTDEKHRLLSWEQERAAQG